MKWCVHCGESLGGTTCANCDGPLARLLPTPTTSDTNGAGAHGDGGTDLRTTVSLLPTPFALEGIKGSMGVSVADRIAQGHQVFLTHVIGDLLPTPAVNDMGAAYTPEEWDAWTDRMKAEHGNGNGHGKSLSIEAQRLLPTPKAADGDHPGIITIKPGQQAHLSAEVYNNWGDYAPAIHRWEQILGRPAPAPTMTSAKGNPQLSPRFVEWMQGLDEGWVDDVPNLTRNEKLKALGNGVVWQQAAEAVLRLLALTERGAA